MKPKQSYARHAGFLFGLTSVSTGRVSRHFRNGRGPKGSWNRHSHSIRRSTRRLSLRGNFCQSIPLDDPTRRPNAELHNRIGSRSWVSHTAVVESQEKTDTASRAANPLDAVVVSATRSEQSLGNLPTPVRVLGAAAIANTPAATVTDLLRTIPGFTTRDFQAGIMSGPSQGIVTFRGLTGSSAGRALVLLDGIPIGDPFSGWIDWGRVPLPMIASAEVVRGGGSMVWGSRALAGVINLRTITPRRDGATMLIERGTFDTWHGSGAATLKRGKVSAVFAADYIDTEGYVLLPPHQAGLFDEPQSIRNSAAAVRVTYDATPELQLWAGGSAFNGGERPFDEGDDQEFGEVRGGVRWAGRSSGIATVGLFANNRLARSTSFTVNSDRSSQSRQRFGRSPAHSAGLSAQWTQLVSQRHELTTGIDFTSATGSLSEVYAFRLDEPTEERKAGATQELAGLFIQDAADIGKAVRMVASASVDRCTRRTPHEQYGPAAQHILSTRASAIKLDIHSLTPLVFAGSRPAGLPLRANGYESFRAPSMYEMYIRVSPRPSRNRHRGEFPTGKLNAGVALRAESTSLSGRPRLGRVTGYTNRCSRRSWTSRSERAGTSRR